MIQLYCGHRIPDAFYDKMFQAKIVRCPKCGMEWRGWQVIAHDKSLAKKELAFQMSKGSKGRKY